MTSELNGGTIARRLIPGAIAVPLILGGLIIQGYRAGYYDPAFGMSLLVILLIIIFVVIIRQNATFLNRVDSDRKRVQAEHEQLLEREKVARVKAETAIEQLSKILESITDGFIGFE